MKLSENESEVEEAEEVMETEEEKYMMSDHVVNTDFVLFLRFGKNEKHKNQLSVTIDPSKESPVWKHFGKLVFRSRTIKTRRCSVNTV
jgi:hypothetical protein